MLKIEKYNTEVKVDHFVIQLFFMPENLTQADYKGIEFCLTGKKKIAHKLKPMKNLYNLELKFTYDGDSNAFIQELFRMSDNNGQIIVHSLYDDELYSVWANLLLRWIKL